MDNFNKNFVMVCLRPIIAQCGVAAARVIAAKCRTVSKRLTNYEAQDSVFMH